MTQFEVDFSPFKLVGSVGVYMCENVQSLMRIPDWRLSLFVVFHVFAFPTLFYDIDCMFESSKLW